MPFIPNTDEDRAEMLKAIGVKNFEELLENIPANVRFQGDLKLPLQLSEYEVVKELGRLAKKNANATEYVSFIGGGVYDRFIPSIVPLVMGRSEFQTAYTPYQAEVAQGTLQVIYEFQSMICKLTGMDIANASMYDGASALAEACLLASAYTGKKEIVVAGKIHPHYFTAMRTVCDGREIIFHEVKPGTNGAVDAASVKAATNEKTAAVIISQPNFFGVIEDARGLANVAHEAGALFIMNVDPISLGILTSPAECGADIVTGEGQPLGIATSFGGPYLGIFAVKQELIRKIPGRLAGVTVDLDGRRGFVLTLQTREQQIKRDKATSNICTNQGLFMLAATVYMSTMGKSGLREVAEQSTQRAHYLAEKISSLPGYSLRFPNASFFDEFVVSTPAPAAEVIKQLAEKKFLAGIDLKRFEGYGEGLLIAVTEKRSREELDAFAEALQSMT